MNFEPTEEQQMVRQTIREFAMSELAPGAAERDENEIYPAEQLRKLGDLGFLGVSVPPEDGGAGLDMVSYAIAVEELGRVDASTAIIVSVTNSLACYPLEKFATPEQKKAFLQPLASGAAIGAFALTEPDAGSDAGAMKTTAIRDGDYYVLNGSKSFISSGQNCRFMIVFALTDREKGVKGISAFVLEKGIPGFIVGKKEHKLGIRGSDCHGIIFEDCRVPVFNRLGEEGMGFKIAMTALNSGRVGVAAQALGIAQGAMDESIKYSLERKQFGKTLSQFQATQFKIARMATEIEAARFLLYSAAHKKDLGKPFIKEAAMAKLYCSEVAVKTCLEAVQIHGGYGYVKEYPVERFLRDSKITTIYEGTNEVMHMVISEQVYSKAN